MEACALSQVVAINSACSVIRMMQVNEVSQKILTFTTPIKLEALLGSLKESNARRIKCQYPG